VIFVTLLRTPEAPSDETEASADGLKRPTLSVTRERHRRYRLAISVGVIVSVVLHLVVIVLSPLMVRYVGPLDLYPPVRRVRPQPTGMQAVDVRITETPRVERPPVREPQPEPEPEPEETAPVAVEGEAEPVLSAAERLRPRIGDWRLWIIVPLAPRKDLTPEERVAQLEDRLYARLEAYDDSLAAEAIRQAEQMDWTVGEEGNKWGVSPGQIHLGPITLPLPFYLGPTRETEGMLRDYDAIQRQSGQADIDDSFEARVKAIREREKARRDTTSSGGG
jgi:hypothetical protein